ncbi:ATP-dependent DNA ligase [Wenzhouxiangella sp. XN79A]|uniref:ATP-dependent DNA ligase n=1 Tax=Wenzhouxiangella sp. XN79A TaxID=2724193 RepID=UPI00144A5876|nr:ATP-dependent DNA ligase [Wenzhouxiangella sp. XN79A]NKI34627.1 ATP-dependent DNA ligase [Wenzhouxiangella sp. XN79A]
MKRFVAMFRALDGTTGTNAKVAALTAYFRDAEPRDAAWAVYFLTGQRLKRLVTTRELREWTAEHAGLPLWLVEESYEHVGDLAETMTLLTPEPESRDVELPPLHALVERVVRPLGGLDDDARREAVTAQWAALPETARFLFNKLITGALRVGVSKRLVTRALAELAGVEPGLVAHRLMGQWQPTAENFCALVAGEGADGPAPATPYPFFLASPLDDPPSALGEPGDWRAEWKWDGIRAQLIRRAGEHFLWSRGEELLNGRFPEIESAAEALPNGTVLDGEIMAWDDRADRPLPFSVLQTRIGRKKPGPKTLARAPCTLLVFDLLEHGGEDLRARPLSERRALMRELIEPLGSGIRSPDDVVFDDWNALPELRASSRERGVEGLMLKRAESPYRVGRTRGDWWKWKIEPYTFDGVLLYAQPGHGRRSNLFTDYTFAVHGPDGLVPVAKAYSGLNQKEIDELDRWIRQHTKERFGPVRSVEPVQVFELAFEGIARSSRHKSGLALRFPRIHRWRRDLDIAGADRLEDLERLLPA